MKKAILLLLPLGLASGACSTGGHFSDYRSPASQYPVIDTQVKNCEAWVDKVATIEYRAQRMQRGGINLFVKVDTKQVQPLQVVLYGRHSGENFYPIIAKQIAADYYELDLGIYNFDADAGGGETSIEGAIYVDTAGGKRYWINPADGGNFMFNRNFLNNVSYKHNPGAVTWSPVPLPLNQVLKTADIGSGSESYVNPKGCR